MSNKLQSVDRALQILLQFEEEGQELGVTELAARVGVHKSSASRLAGTLAGKGFLERGRDGEAFRLGPQLRRLGVLAARPQDLVELVRAPMEALAERTGETVTFSVTDGDEAATIAQVDARYVVGVQNWVGRRFPVHCTSDGKVLLAFGAVELDGRPLPALTPRTITRKTELQRELDTVRCNGWASAVGEFEEGLNGAAAPVVDMEGRCRGTLSVSGPSYRVSAAALPELGSRCKRAADEIGARLVT
jgi:DNA-binding IclR family transcriptional regulator